MGTAWPARSDARSRHRPGCWRLRGTGGADGRLTVRRLIVMLPVSRTARRRQPWSLLPPTSMRRYPSLALQNLRVLQRAAIPCRVTARGLRSQRSVSGRSKILPAPAKTCNHSGQNRWETGDARAGHRARTLDGHAAFAAGIFGYHWPANARRLHHRIRACRATDTPIRSRAQQVLLCARTWQKPVYILERQNRVRVFAVIASVVR
jgi:hypothetical protein